MLTFCSHPRARKPALSKESALSENVNMYSEPANCSHLCSYSRPENAPNNVNKTLPTDAMNALDHHPCSRCSKVFLENSVTFVHNPALRRLR